MSTTLAYVEAHAALAAAHRRNRLSSNTYSEAAHLLDGIWEEVVAIPVQPEIIAHAASLASAYALRGYDAVHAATAITVASSDFVAISGDRELLRAWGELGMHTINTSQ